MCLVKYVLPLNQGAHSETRVPPDVFARKSLTRATTYIDQCYVTGSDIQQFFLCVFFI